MSSCETWTLVMLRRMFILVRLGTDLSKIASKPWRSRVSSEPHGSCVPVCGLLDKRKREETLTKR